MRDGARPAAALLLASRAMPASRDPAFLRRPLRLGPARGDAWRSLSDEELALFAGWAEAGTVEDGQVLKANDVFRHGDHLVKFFPPAAWPLALRTSAARRSGRRHAELAWLPVPEPVVSVDGCGPDRRGLLVTRFVDGADLKEMRVDPRAIDALADYLVRMHGAGVHHGDLHPGNLRWDGTRWWLLDLDAVRSGAHLLRARRLRLRQWARLVFKLEGEEWLRGPFDRYLAQLPIGLEPDEAWRRVLRISRALRSVRDKRRAQR